MLNVLQKSILQSILPEREMCQAVKENKITPHMSFKLLFSYVVQISPDSRAYYHQVILSLLSLINLWIEYSLTWQVYLSYRFAHFSPRTRLTRSLPDYGFRYSIDMNKCFCTSPGQRSQERKQGEWPFDSFDAPLLEAVYMRNPDPGQLWPGLIF